MNCADPFMGKVIVIVVDAHAKWIEAVPEVLFLYISNNDLIIEGELQ